MPEPELPVKITDTELLNWLEETGSGLYFHVSGFGPVWEVNSLPDPYRCTYRTCRAAIIAAATRFPTLSQLKLAQDEASQRRRESS